MSKILNCILFLVLSSNVFSQERMTLIDQKTIPATEIWQFSSDTYTYSGSVNVQIANNGKGGTLLVQVEASNSDFKISGTVYLFLEDGNVITCTDKNLRSSSDKTIKSFYYLTPEEIILLTKNKVTDIRFRIIGNATPFSSPIGFFTAKNKIRSFALSEKSYDTVTEIRQLFIKS